MSRRESRVSINVRQNDALFEFESFKKKFLLANKHITKLNSTLSVRIEELNAQISGLYVENLRLRASEIALAAQLKRERQKSSKIMADAEAATLNLTKHLGHLRQSFNIQLISPATPTPSPPRARRPPANHNPNPHSPQGNRISRPPNVPGIYEEDEPLASSSEQEPGAPQAAAHRKSKPKPRLSASRLPLPSRVSSPPPLPTPASLPLQMDMDESRRPTNTRKKPSRRQSGLLNVQNRTVDNEAMLVPRVPSPAFGSPIRREAALAEEEDEIAAANDEVEVDVDAEFESLVSREKRKGKSKEQNAEKERRDRDRDIGVEAMRPRERERKRAREEDDPAAEGSKLKLKDVTNSPRSRTALPPVENPPDRNHQTSESEAGPSSNATTRTFLTTPSTTPPLPPYLPTPRASSSPVAQNSASETEVGGTVGGRERRTRKSVNYAEPKLNTKMRKPDPAPGLVPSVTPHKKRSSSTVVAMAMATYIPVDDNDNDHDSGRSSIELPLGLNGHATLTAASVPLPPSRPVSSASMVAPTVFSGRPSSSSSSSLSAATTSVKRKKSRPHLVLDDEESDGAQADAEYGGGSGSGSSRSGTSGWVNLEGRRRSVQSGGSGLRRVVGGIGADDRRLEGDDGRRHSMAV